MCESRAASFHCPSKPSRAVARPAGLVGSSSKCSASASPRLRPGLRRTTETTMQMTKILDVKLVETNVYTRWSCTVCGGRTEKEPILAEGCSAGCTDCGDKNCGGSLVRVCEFCLQAGDIDKRLNKHITEMLEEVDSLRSLIGRLRVPTYAAWKAACEAHEERWVRENTNCATVAEY